MCARAPMHVWPFCLCICVRELWPNIFIIFCVFFFYFIFSLTPAHFSFSLSHSLFRMLKKIVCLEFRLVYFVHRRVAAIAAVGWYLFSYISIYYYVFIGLFQFRFQQIICLVYTFKIHEKTKRITTKRNSIIPYVVCECV